MTTPTDTSTIVPPSDRTLLDLSGEMIAFQIDGLLPGGKIDRRPSGFRCGRVQRVVGSQRNGVRHLSVRCAGGGIGRWEGRYIRVQPNEISAVIEDGKTTPINAWLGDHQTPERTATDMATKKKSTKATMKATAAADQENARLRDERSKSKDGMTASERAMANSAKAKPKAAAAPKPKPNGKAPSLLDLAVSILKRHKQPLNAKQIVEKAMAAGWTTSGKTPDATLSAAIGREIRDKGKDSRFKKAGRGQWKGA